jgi:hypothetical protein
MSAGAPSRPPRYSSVVGLPKLEGESRKRAIEDPGPSWREWFYSSFMKTWLVLGFLILDSWAALTWAQPLNVPAMAGSVAAAAYGEFLLWRFLWYNPDREEDRRNRSARARWLHPVRFGRWTPQHQRMKQGLDPFSSRPRPAPISKSESR